MADDVAGLVRHLGVEQIEVFGYSLAGGAALQVAMRHPELVRKLVVASASSTSDGGVFGDLAGLPSARLAVLPGTNHVGLIGHVDWLAPMVGEFLYAPEAGSAV